MKTKIFHILNGDALKSQFPEKINGELIVARECLIDGEVGGETLNEFWKNRANYLDKNFAESNGTYFLKVVPEFEKIINIPSSSIINLWFEEDLFCQVNLWFCAFLLQEKSGDYEINLVRPFSLDWRGFGGLTRSELELAYENRIALNKRSIELLSNCWQAYKINDLQRLKKLSFKDLDNFPMLPEVVQAHADRFGNENKMGRPERALLRIIRENKTRKFGDIFQMFSKSEGIYGFGDTQVKAIYENVLKTLR